MTEEIRYLILLVCLLLVPKVLLRFRIPTGLTALLFGLLTTLYLGWFKDSQLVEVLGTLGITSLFLFAGLEIDYYELKDDLKILLKKMIKASLIIAACSVTLSYFFQLGIRPSVILSLGLLTPSTGFILNSIGGFKFTEEQSYWIRTQAIANEVLAIFIMFVALQSDSLPTLSISFGVLAFMVIILPIVFRTFLKIVAPFAPDSEVTFLVLLAFICGIVTRELGTYYLVGAFVVGVVAAQFRHFVKTERSEKMFYAVGFLSSLLIPFYFFKAGVSLGSSEFSWDGLLLGILFSIIFIPVRYGSALLSIKLFLGTFWKDRLEIAVSLMPTLIFGLVMASILKQKFAVEDSIVLGLVFYTIISSIFPTLVLEKAPPEEYDTAFVGSRKLSKIP